ncbi:MAG: zinc ribbon domain-containing protein [Solobacterium sp.]|nr:zinc ribbon domain-containing protein [Solobacterium sp.]
MTVKLIAVQCPQCGANLRIEEDRQQAFCTYCGAQVLIHNENEHIYRYVDEADIKHAENEKKKLELLEKVHLKETEANKSNKQTGLLMIIFGIIAWFVCNAFTGSLHYLSSAGFVIAIVGFVIFANGDKSLKEMNEELDPSIKKLPPFNRVVDTKQSYESLVEIFRLAGFTNIRCIAAHDLKWFLDKRKENTVISVDIDNTASITYYGKHNYKAPADVPIVITYHSF